MIFEPKTLVILDTNKIRNNFDWETDYTQFEFKGDFDTIINWIEDNKLQNLVSIGLPEIVIKEVITNRAQNFDKELERIKSGLEKLKNMDCVNFSKLILPHDEFNYKNFIASKITELAKKKKFMTVMKLEKKRYAKTLDTLIKKAINKEKPFADSKGFKDALIWEIILNSKNIGSYSNIFLLTENQRDFADLQEKFTKKFSKDLNLEIDTNILIISLEEIYGWRVKYSKILEYLRTYYFKSKLIEFLSESYDLEIKNFKLVTISKISELESAGELKEFELFDTYSEDFLNLKKVYFLFKNRGQEFNAELIIESTTNEILAVNYEESN